MHRMKCGDCGIEYAVPDYWYQTRIQDRNGFWCPNGHERHFVNESDETKLRRERDRLKQNVAMWEDNARQLREVADAANRQARAYKGQVTKLKKRAIAGVCPCCSRSFENLRRHMETKHPDMVEHKVVPIKRQA